MLAFTICSNNYIAEALTLGDSLVRNGLSQDRFLIFICDKSNKKILYENFNYQVFAIDQLIVPNFENLLNKFEVVELNTAVKPSIFKYLAVKFPKENICYLDPDLNFYHDVKDLETELGESSILLTPHITQPRPIAQVPAENVFLNYGLYNLGFLLLKVNKATADFLNWWEERTHELGINNPSVGLFVDQLWINLVPIFFGDVKISKHLGLNVAYWNLNERFLTRESGHLKINGQPLMFFHFSSFDFDLKQISRRGYSKLDVSQEEIVKALCIDYKQKLEMNGYTFYKTIGYAYKLSFDNYLKRFLPQKNISKKELKILMFCNAIIPRRLLKYAANLYHKITVIENY